MEVETVPFKASKILMAAGHVQPTASREKRWSCSAAALGSSGLYEGYGTK